MIELHINMSYLCVIKPHFVRIVFMKTNDIFNLLHNGIINYINAISNDRIPHNLLHIRSARITISLRDRQIYNY